MQIESSTKGFSSNDETYLKVLPGELTAEEILNGAYPFPLSPQVAVTYDSSGFASNRLSPPPPPGVHPRLLLSPDDLPDLRRRLVDTVAGSAMLATLRERVREMIGKAGSWENTVFESLAWGDTDNALATLKQRLPPTYPPGHYQPHILYAIVMEAFDAMVLGDEARGRKAAAAVSGYARMIEGPLREFLAQPLSDDVWRIKVAGPTTGDWSESQGLRELMGGHLLGYAYDFAFNFMTESERAEVRTVIATATHGKIFLGASLPHHWRNWNWIMCALAQPLLALAIEGEEGYDPRVYRLGVEIAEDYLTYGISACGCSTEAVGYTQFGLVWGLPFLVAAARRGDDLLTHSHHRAMIEWYLQSMEPFALDWVRDGHGDFEQTDRNLPATWTSHGDGGDEGPSIMTMMMWKRYFPDDPRIDILWKAVVRGGRTEPFTGRYHIVEALIWATDGDKVVVRDENGASPLQSLGEPLTWFDPERGSLITRSAWTPDALTLEFECRTDSVCASHEHADRSNFTFTSHGRSWARENFRSVETRHHNSILIDGHGQGFWPGPGVWLGHRDSYWALLAACDTKAAYDWWWPKAIVADPQTSERFKYPRWASMASEGDRLALLMAGDTFERDTRPSVVSFFQGYDQGDPRMWDEDGWSVRAKHNPVERAFRTIALVRNPYAYTVIVDDIQKDDQERLYEWLMITGLNTDVVNIDGNDVVLCDASVARDGRGSPQPQVGDRQLLVRVLNMGEPSKAHDYQSRPSIRLETFERKDTLAPDGRSYGKDKRLVVPCRAVSADFKILLFPHRNGDELPETLWNAEKSAVAVKWSDHCDTVRFGASDGRTSVTVEREGSEVVKL